MMQIHGQHTANRSGNQTQMTTFTWARILDIQCPPTEAHRLYGKLVEGSVSSSNLRHYDQNKCGSLTLTDTLTISLRMEGDWLCLRYQHRSMPN